MSVLDVLYGPWAIRPAMLTEIHRIYEVHSSGGETDWLKAYRSGKSDRAGIQRGYTLHNGVAVISVEGVLGRKLNMFEAISGGQSYELIGAAIDEALSDDRAEGILLNVHSPGGIAFGAETLANKIRAANDIKPVTTWTDGVMASAAYWLGMSAGEVYIGASTADVGSIGVVATHVDVSGAEAKEGVKTTEITAGKYKRIASNYEPLSKEGRASIQDQVDAIYAGFVDQVAHMRGTDAETVLKKMADGRDFIGTAAIDAGLVDGMKSFDEAIESTLTRASEKRATSQRKRTRSMDKDTLRAENPALYDSIKAEGAAEAVTAERERISQIQASAFAGQDKLVAECVADGSTVAAAQSKFIAAEKAAAAERTTARFSSGSSPLPNPATPMNGDGPKQPAGDAHAINRRAQEYIRTEAAKGRTVSHMDAVMAVVAEGV